VKLLEPYAFHITVYDIVFFGVIIIGLTFALQLWFKKDTDRAANRFLALALGIMVLSIEQLLGIDTGLNTLPQFSLAFGPLIYFYVRKATRQEWQVRWKDMLHFCPVLLELVIWTSKIPFVVKPLTFVSVGAYLYLCHRLIERFYTHQKFNEGDRYRYAWRWLHRLLAGLGVALLLWIPLTAIDYFGFHFTLHRHAYYLLSLIMAFMIIRMGVVVLLRPASDTIVGGSLFPTSPISTALKQKGNWLKKMIETGLLFQDPELSVSSLARQLDMPAYELSRIINIALKKNFADLINEYRIRDVVGKMQDPAYDHITLLGIAFESGFNSKTTFNRTFKQMTGKSPAEYKSDLKKERPFSKMERFAGNRPVVLNRESLEWYHGKLNGLIMFRNYFKMAWRNIVRHKLYSFINVMGLALGICGCLVIYLVAGFEFSFDTFHPDKERIYCVDIGIAGSTEPDHNHWNCVPAPMPTAMRDEMSGIEKVAAFQHYNPKTIIKQGSKTIKTFDNTNGIIAGSDYFDILPYTWLSGNKNTSLSKPMTVVLTQSRAKTYFGDLRPEAMIGKTITYDDSLTVTVTGILQDWNKNSDFNFSEFISFSTITSSFLRNQIPLDNWGFLNHGSQELVKLSPGVDPTQVNKQFPEFIKKHLDPDPKTKLFAQLQPFTSIHFHREYGGEGNKADLTVMYILSAVALFILIIAAINFINLSTAQSIQRTREIGIRKVLGSGKSAIILQLLTETFMLALMAVTIAVAAVRPVLNLLASFIPTDVKFDLTAWSTLAFLIGIAVFTTLLAGLYPAKLLSSFQPVSSLKGEISARTNNKGRLRKSLIVFQFVISLIFITGTIVIAKQINYMQTRYLGFKTNNIIILRSLWNAPPEKMKVLAQNIKQLSGVEQVITEAAAPMGFAHMGNGIQLKGSGEKPFQVSVHSGNEDFVPFYHMKVVAGRNLLHSDSTKEFLINETAAKALGFNKPQQSVGRLVEFAGQKKAYPIAGVVADFFENSFHQQMMPVVITNDPKTQFGIALKLTPAEYQKGDMTVMAARIAREWKKIFPNEAFDYSFLGDSITKLYESDTQTQWLMRTATLITIFISCMGLFGLAMFSTERRAKEIGIRKVLGASVGNILALLNKDVIILIAISLLISSPISWFFMHKWLQNFAYHTDFSLWIFGLAGGGALLIAMVTISFQTIQSAIANPIKGLRNE
jgi:ABC-type antimicrobial peptide transport system permease subunit/AraC-like DNA-binding protein